MKTLDGAVGAEISPLKLYSKDLPLQVNIYEPPNVMVQDHWHGHIEINIPFDDNVEYMFNGESILVHKQHIVIFWATVPHRLINKHHCSKMAVLDIPVSTFLSWHLSQNMVTQLTHGMVIQSKNTELVSAFEICRWENELKLQDKKRHQIVFDEIQLMVKRLNLDGWRILNDTSYSTNERLKSSRHTQHYVNQMLDFIAQHYNEPLTVSDVAGAVGLNTNYAMGLFQDVMKLTIKQYIISMKINHAKTLLADTDKTMLDISLTVGFNSLSRFYDNFQKQTGISPQSYRKTLRKF